MNQQRKSVIYLRVASVQSSTPLQERVQEAECRRYAADAGYEVAAVFADIGASGMATQRKGLTEMLSFLNNAAEPGTVIVATDLERLSRDTNLTTNLLATIRAAGAIFETALR